MPRTKVSKSTKRNREDANREEKIREFDASLDKYMNMLDRKAQEKIEEINSDIKMMLQRTSTTILKMKMSDFVQLADWDTKKFNEIEANSNLLCPTNTMQSLCSSLSSTTINSAKVANPNDEGYLTADGSERGSVIGATTFAAYRQSSTNMLQLQSGQQQRGRTPGPFSSARARRPRRSRSACSSDAVIASLALKPLPSATPADHASRNKLRTPVISRGKAVSADRVSHNTMNMKSPASAFMRWPKPGELVVSMCGSPIVAQVMPDKYANVNIPVKNGVLSLRPKKLSELKPGILEAIDAETLDQIKTLHENLNLIMNMASK